MNDLIYLIYLLIFIIGLISGLLTSYKKHGEPFIFNDISMIALVMAILGWVLLFNYGLFSFIFPEILISISLFLIAFVGGMRPGYGRKETIIGVIISLFIWIIFYMW